VPQASRKTRFLATAAAVAALYLSSLTIGPAGLRPPPPLGPLDLVAFLRLYRATLAASTGALLGLAGALIQYATSNPLAAPTILGLPQGALAAAAAAVIATGGASPAPVLAAATLGALAAYTASVLLAARGGLTGPGLVVAGVAVSSAATGLAGLLLYVSQARTGVYTPQLLLGTYAYATRGDALLSLTAALALAAATLPLYRGLDLLSYGDTVAASTGAPPGRIRVLAATAAAAAVAVTIDTSGLVGFIGLIAPNAARSLYGGHPRAAVPGSLLLGAVVSLGADVATRLLAPMLGLGELPAATATSLFGGFFLAYLVARKS